MTPHERTLLSLALETLDRPVPNVVFAREVLRELVISPDVVEPGNLTITEAAARLGLSPQTIRAKIADGKIPALGSGRATRIPIDEAIAALRRVPRSDDEDPIAAAGRAAVRGSRRVQ